MKEQIQAELRQLEEKTQKRVLKDISFFDDPWIVMNGRKLLNLASNNYLGLASDERLIEAGCKAMRTYGASATASRLIVGNYEQYARTERALIKWKQAEAALIINSGYTANIGIITALIGQDDIVFSDWLNHASIIDGIMLSRAERHRYYHNDLNHLESLLKKAPSHKRKLIVTDTIFSMDGDIAPLEGLVTLKKRYNAILMVDEAHSSGIYGEQGEGLAHYFRLQNEIDIQMGTFSKALGCFGAYVTGEQWLIDYLMNKMRSFIFTTALPPAVLGSIEKAIEIVQTEQERRETLQTHSHYFRHELKKLGFHIGESTTHIVPIIIGPNDLTVRFSERLQEHGIAAVVIRPPTVPEGTSRIRFSLTSSFSKAELDWALEQIACVGKEMGIIP
ncbi:8-amino-7-oxononanoate synthase [Thermaerobacillus caldiproteolyticus]|uniref:8-amino-7-ketopelargonate synthase n=1 Tax=Thermaerobacillus caldiproteolyticus TaxID=247480 RepID=A0A7V9Z6S2_9BACL|nr:8-amino-7-oxononanoate synthase [Anoxybacillus caldiproteolyticus]MBA2875122.1 8-amino-7-oxononanoate synthase [Anoxybacillus caldiproteolyticus]